MQNQFIGRFNLCKLALSMPEDQLERSVRRMSRYDSEQDSGGDRDALLVAKAGPVVTRGHSFLCLSRADCHPFQCLVGFAIVTQRHRFRTSVSSLVQDIHLPIVVVGQDVGVPAWREGVNHPLLNVFWAICMTASIDR